MTSAYRSMGSVAVIIGVAAACGSARAGVLTSFAPGDLVISTVTSSTGNLDSAGPITLEELALGSGGTSATSVGTLALPQSQSGANYPISGEYGSASEGVLQRSANGEYLTIMGYGVNANTFNNAAGAGYGTTALGQTTSVTGTGNTVVPRVVALIGPNGSVDTTTALTGVFNQNNPRSATTVNGSQIYVSGQGASEGDSTEGVFLANRGATTATPIYTGTDTRIVSIFNTGSGDTLYVSRDVNPPGSGGQNETDVNKFGSGGLPTTATSLTRVVPSVPSVTGGNYGSIDLPTDGSLSNNVNASREGKFVYLSPESYFFASPDVLYVADSGSPKNGNANKAALGEGGLQKWVLQGSQWDLVYDLYQGLNLVNNANADSGMPTAPGVTGLYGLTGKVIDGQVELFATTYGLNELSPSYLYEITDPLNALTYTAGEQFTQLYSAPLGTAVRGVAFAPVPEPGTLAILGGGVLMLGLVRRRRNR